MSLIKRTGNIYEQQLHNRRITMLLVFGFVLYFLLLGYGTDFFLLGTDAFGLFQEGQIGFPVATFLTLIISCAYAVYTYYRADELVLHAVSYARAWRIEDDVPLRRVWIEDNPNDPLVHVVQEMSLAAGIPVPAIYVISDRDLNAFATGRDPSNASIAFTRGLLKECTREELQAVAAHEIAHIKNYDTRLMMMVAALTAGDILLIRYAQARWLASAGRLRVFAGATIFFFVWIGLVITTPIFTRLVSMLLTREREYQADATAALLTRNPLGLVKALQKLDDAVGPTRTIHLAISHLCIVDPMGRFMQVEEEGLFSRVLPTHPKISDRIAALNEMAYILGRKDPPQEII